MPVYISTSCLANGSNVFDVLETYAQAGLSNVELGSSHKYVNHLSPSKFRKYNFDFSVHHYFPPPEEPFVVNLASQNPVILERSREQIKKSIKFCHRLGSKLFTFHAGLRADPDNKLRFPKDQPIVSYEVAFSTFVDSVNEINRYARDKKVRIGVENNVLSEYNVVNRQNIFLLLCEAEEFERLWEKIPSDNVGMVLDLGHLKVTSHWLGFDRYEFIDRVKDRVFSIHVHENNGIVDEHRELDEKSWCLEVISREYFAQVPIVLESMNLSIDRILKNIDLVKTSTVGAGCDTSKHSR